MPSKTAHKEKDKDRDRDRDLDSPKSKEKTRHKSSRSSRKEEKPSNAPERSQPTDSSTKNKRKTSMPIPELERRSSTSPSNSKTSLPYPSFSKAHSKEAVGNRDQAPNPRASYHTPDPTDLSKNDAGPEEVIVTGKEVTPPSPPETTVDQKIKLDSAKVDTIKVERKRTDLQKHADELKRKLSKEGLDSAKVDTVRVERKRTDLQKHADELKRKLSKDGPRSSEVSRRKHSHSSRSRSETKEASKDEKKSSSSPKPSKPSTPSKLRPRAATVEDAESSTSFRKASSSLQSAKSEGTTDSDATSIAPNQQSTQRPVTPMENRDSSPSTQSDLPEPRTPTLSDAHGLLARKETPSISIVDSRAPSVLPEESPMPPPPPPAPSEMPAPKVDYLLQNGGLTQAVNKSFLAAGSSPPLAQSTPAIQGQAESFFTPFNRVLDDFSKVISKKGSLAVATGYRSVARRLLDRLEAVFARDISSETCICEVCQQSMQADQEPDDKRGISWGEILEYVCGRQELPPWPPFAFDNVGLGIAGAERATPMQKLDIDVPEEFREHYVRQSKRTKQAVDKWLESQPTDPVNLPRDVDDETLTFAMLTRLDAEQRPIFSSILGVSPSRPASTCFDKSTTSILPPTSELLEKTGLAIQRLYRLPGAPRHPESAMYLLMNPAIHNVLATLAAISDGEWDILISGRFDGFLRSGAEDDIPTPTVGNIPLPFGRSASRSNNQLPSSLSRPPTSNANVSGSYQPLHSNIMYPPSRGPTPFSGHNASVGAPVALDEETEIATLAEIEREIYLGMEALEDAFESLHVKAETVRHALRERGAGLAQASQTRRTALGIGMGIGSGVPGLDSRLGTPASVFGGNWESETDDGLDDGISELAPDDSASCASRSRVRRPRRRNERRTPAPVEEEDEDGDEAG